MRFMSRPGAFAVLAAALLFPASSHAQDVAACVQASEQAQSLRDEGKYKKAREQLFICSRDACPAVVRKDCVQWLQELDASMPSVVITAKDGNGKDLVDVKVTVDGQTFAERLDGKPIPLDPGKHTVRYEAAGVPPVEEELMIHAAEKNRLLNVKLGKASPDVSTPPPSTTLPPDTDKPSRGGIPASAFVIGGIGVVALGSFAFFGLTGKADVSEMRSTCAPNCEEARVSSARTKLLLADVSLTVGVVALGVATWMIISGSKSAPASTASVSRVDVRPIAGGGVAEFGGRF